MAKSLLIVLLVASVFVQHNEAFFWNQLTTLMNPWAAYQKVMTDAANARASADAWATKLVASADNATKLFDSTLKSMTDAAYASANNTIFNAYDKAFSLGGAPKNCVIAMEQEITDLTISQTLLLAGCVTEKITKALYIAESLVKDSIQIANETVMLDDNLYATCNPPFDWTKALCSTGVIVRAAANVATDVADITKQIADAQVLITSLATIQIDLPACLTLRAAQVTFNIAAPLGKLVACSLIGSK